MAADTTLGGKKANRQRLTQAKLFHASVEGRSGEAEGARGLGDVAAVLLQGPLHHRALELLERELGDRGERALGRDRRRKLRRRMQGQLAQPDPLAVREDDRALDDVL